MATDPFKEAYEQDMETLGSGTTEPTSPFDNTTLSGADPFKQAYEEDIKTIGAPIKRKAPRESINNAFSKVAAQKQYEQASAKTQSLKDRISAYPSTIKKTYRMADKQIAMGRLGDKWMEGKASDAEIKQIHELNNQITSIAHSIKDKPYEAKAATQLIPYVQNAVSKGGKHYLVGSMIGMSAAAIAGNVTPAVAFPEEAVTIPMAGHLLGKAFATFGVGEDMRKIEGGNAFIQLLQEGVHPNIARWAGRSYGLASAGLELGQIKLLTKLFPKATAPALIKRAVRKVVSKRIANASIAKALGKQAMVATGEGGVEATQQLFENIIGTLAKEYQDYAKETNVSPDGMREQWDALKNGVAESFAQTFVGVGILGIPSVGINYVVDKKTGKGRVETNKDRELRDKEKAEEETVKEKTPKEERKTDVKDRKEKAEVEEAVEETEKSDILVPTTKRDETTEEVSEPDAEVVKKPKRKNLKEQQQVVTPQIEEKVQPIKEEVIKEASKPAPYDPALAKAQERTVKFFQKDLTKPAIRTADGVVFEGTEFSDTWSVSKPDVAVKEGRAAYAKARDIARDNGYSLEGHDQGFMVDDNFISTETIAEKVRLADIVAEKKATRILEQGLAEEKAIANEIAKANLSKEKLNEIRPPTKQDMQVMEELLGIKDNKEVKKGNVARIAVRKYKARSILSDTFSAQQLVNVARGAIWEYIRKVDPADIDAFVNGDVKSEITGTAHLVAKNALRNYIKDQLGSKQGKSRRKVDEELKAGIFRDTKQLNENQKSSVLEYEEAEQEAHETGDTAPRAGKSIKDKYFGEKQTTEQVQEKVKSTATPFKKISVEQYKKEKKEAFEKEQAAQDKMFKDAAEKFKPFTPKKKKTAKEQAEYINAQARITTESRTSNPIAKILSNEKGETTLFADLAEAIEPALNAMNKVRRGFVDRVGVQAPLNRVGAPKTGIRIKNMFSRASVEQDRGETAAKKFIKILKESHKGYQITRTDLGEVALAAEDPAYLKAMPPTKQKRIKPGADYLAKYFKDAQIELKSRGISVDFNKRMISELEHQITEEKDGEKVEKLKKHIETLKRTKFVHIPVQMWVDLQVKYRNAATNKMDWGKRNAKLEFILTHRRRAISLGELVRKKAITIEKINPVEIILNYAWRKGKDFALTDIRDAALTEGLIKYQKTKPKGKIKGWEKIPRRLSALTIEGKPQGWIQVEVKNIIDDMQTAVVRRDTLLGKFDAKMAIAKMAAFINPLFLPVYDTVQFFMMGPGHIHQIPGVFKNGYKDVVHKTDNYLEAAANGLFSKPFGLPFEKWKSKADQITASASTTWAMSHVEGLLEQILDLKSGSALKPIYEASWFTAWKLDAIIRMSSYNYLIKRGHTPVEAAQTAALYHGDYAGVPAKTRKALNRFFFTPTFKIAMTKLWWAMGKNFVVTVGGFRKKGTTKEQRRLAYGIYGTLGVNMAFHIFMTSVLGYDDDEFGRRYVKIVDTPQGPKESVISWASPANIIPKYTFRLLSAFKPGVPNTLGTILASNRWELHPVWRTMWEIGVNQRADGDEIAKEFDNWDDKLKSRVHHVGLGIIGAYKVVMAQAALDPTSYSAKQARELLLRDYPKMWRVLEHFLFAYTRDLTDKRKAGKIHAMTRRLRKALRKSIVETDIFNEAWLENFNKITDNILKEGK